MVLDYLKLHDYLMQVEEVIPAAAEEVLVTLRSLSQRVEYLPSDTVEQRCVCLQSQLLGVIHYVSYC